MVFLKLLLFYNYEKMPILNYTTSIDHNKTIGEITTCLVAHGANKIVVDYDGDRLSAAVTFMVPTPRGNVFFSLPCNYGNVLKAMEKNKKVPRSQCNKAQAIRVAWRIVKDWVEAQMAIVEAELAAVEEVFLPYAITKKGNTLYKEIQDSNILALGQ